MSTRASSALRAIPARPMVEAEETPDFGRLVEDLRADLYKALEHGQVADVQNALRGQVGENEVVKQIRGTHRPSGAVIAAMLWFVRAGAQARNLERLCGTYGRTTVPASPSVVEEREVVAQITATMASAARAFSDVLERAADGLDAEEAKECLPRLAELKKEVSRLDLLVLSALTGDGR